MARLLEHRAKELLTTVGLSRPRGAPARTADEAERIAASLGPRVVVKAQAATTGRKALGGIAFATSAREARDHAARMLSMRLGHFPVEEVLIEEQMPLARELFLSLAIDDRERAPVLLLAAGGGSGVEERASDVVRVPCGVLDGPRMELVYEFIARSGITGQSAERVEHAARAVFDLARRVEARSVEINPLAILQDGRVVALDARITIDDYAVFRHPELGIEIARELDHPPTPLERLAYRIEQEDHRGTFFFAQMHTQAVPGSRGLIGFHGAGGGGSMMSMDAVTNEGFTIANFCDTSGNPSPAKVYRAARVILSQPGLVGYFGSGSGVANQEQFWSAYGLAKAFWEMELSIPAVIRLGGNTEDRAVEVLENACKGLPAKVEGYKKNDPPSKIAARFATLVEQSTSGGARPWQPRTPRVPAFVGAPASFSFDIKGGKVWIDAAAWKHHAGAIIARSNALLKDEHARPAITIKPEEFLSKDSEMIACEVECRRDGIDGIFVELFYGNPA